MLVRPICVVVLLCAGLACAQASTANAADAWPGYVSDKKGDRDRAISGVWGTGMVSTGLDGAGIVVRAVWVTDVSLRALVSRQVDEERLSASEAEAAYQKLKASLPLADNHVFFLQIFLVRAGIDDPLNPKALFLERKKDKTVFSRGTLLDAKFGGFGIDMGGPGVASFSHVIACPRKADGQAIVQTIRDEVELSIGVGADKPVVVELNLKDAVNWKTVIRLEDL